MVHVCEVTSLPFLATPAKVQRGMQEVESCD